MSVEREQPYRIFIAIELHAEVRARIAKHIDELRHKFPDVRASWTREENLQFTLKFLGSVPVNRIAQVSRTIEDATCSFSPFQFVVGGCGAFPPHGHPKVLWIGVTDAFGDLNRLYEGLERRFEGIAFPREAQTFRPHITIARVRSAKGGRELAQFHKNMDFAAATVTVREVVLMRSELSGKGSRRYTALARHALKE